MKKVVLLKSRASTPGGLEKHAARIARAFLEKGNHVTLLTTGKELSHAQMDIFSLQTIPWPGFVRIEQFDRFVSRWLNENKVDVVFGMDRNRFQTHIRAGNGVHAAFLESRQFTEGRWKVLLCKMNPLHRKILELEKASFENPQLKKIITNSHFVREQILQRYDTHPHLIEVIHNGVEWHEMQSDFSEWEAKRESALKKWHLNPHHYHFLFIGNGYLRKGLDRLLLGLSKLKRRDFHLSVVGKDRHMKSYQSKVETLGLTKQVRFFGPSSDISTFYQLADSLVIPSFYDPFANVTIEALAMGLYVISSKTNGGCEILTPANGTIIEDLLDTEAVIASLEKALQHPKTKQSANQIRNSVAHLDFSKQMRLLMDCCG